MAIMQYFIHVDDDESDETTTHGPYPTDKAAVEQAEREGERLAELLESRHDLVIDGVRHGWEGGRYIVWQATSADSDEETAAYVVTLEERILDNE